MKLASSLPLRAALGAALALLAGVAVLIALIGAQANRALSERTLETLDTELAEARAVFSADGFAALARHLDRRAAAGSPTRYLLLREGVPARGTLPREAAAAEGAVFAYADTLTGQSHLAAGRRAVIALPDGNSATLLLAHDIDDQRRLARSIQLMAFAGTGAIALAALAFGLSMRRRLLGRVETVTTTSRAIMLGDLSQRIPRDGSGDEMDQMAETLNGMLARIEELMQALRDVSDNIAHDLRTPLNRLRLVAEDALRPEHHDANARDALGRIIEEADGLIKTFNALLLVARLEQGVGADTFEPVDVGRLVEDTTELYLPVAEEARLVMRVDVPAGGDLTLPANRQLLGQAIANLIDNAIKYTPPDRRRVPADIVVTVRRTAVALEISVADSGPGIAAQDRTRALKRFVRLEASRSLPGTGLGLSLVAAVAHLHHGEIRLEDNAPGLRARLILPTALPAAAGAA